MPARAVKPGDSWKSALNISFGKHARVKGERHYTFEEWETVGDRKLAQILITSKLEFELEESRGKGTFKVVTKSSIISSSGVALFDVADGRLILLKDEFHTLGDKTVYVDGNKIQSFGVKSTQTIQTTLLAGP